MSQQINLFSPLFRKQKKLFTAVAMAQAVGFMIVALALFYGYARFQVGHLERQLAVSDGQLKGALEKIKALPGANSGSEEEKKLDLQIAELDAKLAATEQLIAQSGDGERARSYIEPLRALARQRLDGVWLTSISLAGDAGDLSLSGRALQAALVPQYIEHLRRDEAMNGRRFSTLAIERRPPAKAGAPAAAEQLGGEDAVSFRLLASDVQEN
jgi:hypothetical protein